MLMKLKELADVFVDACVRDESGRLLFLSCFGRDTAIQQLFAAFQLKANEGGLDHFHLVAPDAPHYDQGDLVMVGDAGRLAKFAGRLPRENLFGNLAHTWIYDPCVITPDRSTRLAWVVASEPYSEALRESITAKVWETYKDLSPVPLLDHWRDPVMAATAGECVTLMHETGFPPVGRCSAFKVHLPDSFLEMLSGMVKRRELVLEPRTLMLAA